VRINLRRRGRKGIDAKPELNMLEIKGTGIAVGLRSGPEGALRGRRRLSVRQSSIVNFEKS
jgi:hypothetical protein